MPYVLRSDEGSISAVSVKAMSGAEFVDDSDPEFLAFISDLRPGEGDSIDATDLDFVRVLEDLVDLLVAKGVILFTELPESAREKMIFRQRLRSDMAGKLDLLGDD